MLAAVNRGEALVRAFPGNANSKALTSFATTLAKAHAPAEPDTTRRPQGQPSPTEEGLT